VLGAAAIASLMMVFAIQRLPGETIAAPAKPTVAEERFDAAWSDAFQTAVAKRQDRADHGVGVFNVGRLCIHFGHSRLSVSGARRGRRLCL
jgi:hypothetical protein